MAARGARRGRRAKADGDERRVRLKAANPFDLIALLARSQSDPRKAVAELVQNSLDAGAHHVRMTWSRAKGDYALSIQDDGEGVFPDMAREDALRRIATTIGHSHKAGLDPAERHRQMTLGKYGIGLLGFWSVAQAMEIHSRVDDSPVHVLRLEKDQPDATIRRSRAQRLPFEGTFTEIVLRVVHEGVVNQVKPMRLAPYLSQELRGQLLERDVEVEMHDRVARGRAQKRRVVRPVRFEGAPLEGLRELSVPGRRAARLDLYLVPEGDARVGRVALACVGTVVLDDLALLDGPDAPRSPWASGRFEGIVDCSELSVAPSTRRGFVRDAAALDFLAALPVLEERLEALLAEETARRPHSSRRVRSRPCRSGPGRVGWPRGAHATWSQSRATPTVARSPTRSRSTGRSTAKARSPRSAPARGTTRRPCRARRPSTSRRAPATCAPRARRGSS